MPEWFGYGFLRNRRYTQPVNAPRYYLLDKLDHTLDFYHSLEDLGESVEVNIPRDTWLVFPDDTFDCRKQLCNKCEQQIADLRHLPV